MAEAMLCVLGPCTLAPEEVDLSAVQKRILARLALGRPGTVSFEELAEAVWGQSLPASAKAAIHNQISRIRGRLGQDSILTSGGEYSLTIPTDAEFVAGLLDDAQSALDAEQWAELDKVTKATDGMWRGVPFVELDELEEADYERRRFNEIGRSFETLRLEAAIGLGRMAWAIPEAERLISVTPNDEHRWVLLIRALNDAGRRGDALGAYERARRSLANNLGLEPSAVLRSAETEVLVTTDDSLTKGNVPFVGRKEILDQVQRAIGDEQSVLVIGEQGIGKSRVLGELRRRLRRSGFSVAESDCPLHAATAVETLRELAESLGEPFEGTLAPVVSFEAAVRRAARVNRLVVLTVDDIDRAGPTTIEALRAAITIDGVVVLATVSDKTTVGDEPGIEQLALGRFNDDDLSKLTRSMLGSDTIVDPDLLRWLMDMSGGNPTFLQHLVDEVDLNGLPQVASTLSSGVEAQFNSGLGELVRQRSSRLDVSTRRALDVAATCGLMVPSEVLLGLVDDGVGPAVEAGLLDEVTDANEMRWYQFRHGVVREILYLNIAPGQRIEIHHKLASELARYGAPAQVIASHSVAAAEIDPLAAIDDSLAAAAHAASVGAHHEAAGWFSRAVESMGETPQDQYLRVTCLIRHADELRLAGAADQESALLFAVEEAFRIGDEDLIADATFAMLQLGATTESGHFHVRATEIARSSLDRLTDPDHVALIAGGLSLTMSMSDQSETCRDLFLRAESQARTSAVRRNILPFTYLGLGHPDDLELRERLTEELLVLSAEARDPVARFEALQLSWSVGLFRCDGERVRSAIEESTDLVERVGDVGRRWSLHYQKAALAHLDGELDIAEELAEESLRIFGGTSPSRAFSAYGGQILAIRMAQGRVAELAETVEGLLADQPGVPAWNAALAFALAESDPNRARALADRALDVVTKDFTWLASTLIGGRAAAVIGDQALCERYVRELDPYLGLGSWQGTCSYGPVDTVLWKLNVALGHTSVAESHRERARELAMQLDAPVFADELL